MKFTQDQAEWGSRMLEFFLSAQSPWNLVFLRTHQTFPKNNHKRWQLLAGVGQAPQLTQCQCQPSKMPNKRSWKESYRTFISRFGVSAASKRGAVCDQGLWQEMDLCRQLSLFSLKVNPPGVIVLNHPNIRFLKTTVGKWTTKSPPIISCSNQGKLVFVHIPSPRSWNHSTALSKGCFTPAKAKFSKNLLQQSWATAEWVTCKSLLQEVWETSVAALFIHRLLHEGSQTEIWDPLALVQLHRKWDLFDPSWEQMIPTQQQHSKSFQDLETGR